MLDYFIYGIALLITFPLIATALTYMISIKIHRNKLRALHRAVHWTTFFYIVAVSILLDLIVGNSFIGWILVLLLIALAIMIIVQWKSQTEIIFKKAVKVIWRFAFLLFFTSYIFLVLVGIVQRIIG